MPTPHLQSRIARRHLAPLLAVVALTVVGCSSSRSVTNGTSDVIDTIDSSVPTTDPAPVTEASPTTSVVDSVPPDTEPAPAELVLRSTGIGAFDFGLDVETAVDGLSTGLGEPSTITSIDYPIDDGSGQYTTDDGEVGYLYASGRTVCWDNGWCAEFGGGDAESLFFTGWQYQSETGGALATAEGVTIGSRWADFPAIEVAEGGCYSSGSGEVAGVRLALISSGLQFTDWDASGNYVTQIPDPADVKVTSMEAGDLPLFLFGDC